MQRTFLRIGLASFASFGVAACGVGEAVEAPPLAVTEVVRRNLEIVAEAAGTLEPLRSVQVMSKASGEVVEVLVDTGDRVEPGALIARIDPRDVQNDFNQLLADYEVAQQRFDIAESQLRRSQNLLDAGVITDQEHESRNLDFANAQATLVRSQTALDLSRLRLEDVTIRSPMAGTVLARSVEDGQVISSPSGNVSGGTVLVTIADLSVIQVRSLVNEGDVGRIQPGMTATVLVDAFPDRRFQGQVEKIEPQATVQQSVVNFPIIVQLDNSEGLLKPGMSANVTILIAQRPNALALPNEAIVSFEEMVTAADFLGVPDGRLLPDQTAFTELRQTVGLAGGAAAAGAAGANGQIPADLQALRERAQSGSLTPEQLQQMQQQFGGGGRGGRGGNGGGRGDGGRGSVSGATDDARQGVVFVQGADGTLTARAVLVGVTDWSNSEILAGLEEGERVALLGGTQVQAQQGNMNQMFRQMGGAVPIRF
ncbi:MAG: efflux RND transporter periplasmic adaptor subunit [Gemmatimonadota bacterium]